MAKLMDKDEQLQLCIQRFVSDTQSMINQFSEMFIGELRRFADVCMEFSLAYRSVKDERQFLSAENKSLKDELDARSAEVDFLGKELREIREENDELIRKLEGLVINSDGQISSACMDRSRNYAVVNSMPAFPRRYSEAVGYKQPPSPSPDHRPSIELILSTDLDNPASVSKTYLLSPPVGFKTSNSLSPGNASGDETVKCEQKSHSRDDVSSLYIEKQESPDRRQSIDCPFRPKIVSTVAKMNEMKQQDASPSSSMGTFYDCSNQIKKMFGSGSRPPGSAEPVSPDVYLISGQNENDASIAVDIELNQLKKRHLEPMPMQLNASFIAKTPSPTCMNFDKHFDKYHTERDSPIDDAEFLANAPPVQRYNSKKIQKKRKSRKKSLTETTQKDDDASKQTNPIPAPMMAHSVSIIPSPQIDLNRYLLVEVCHVISPSHFYLILNDEKTGTHAFEDFLERFQSFYKSVEDEQERMLMDNLAHDDDEERQLRTLVAIPPPVHALIVGSFWACYVDEELDWRRVQIIGDNRKLEGATEPHRNNDLDDYVVVKDVDSGYSSLVHVQTIRPLTDEMASVPAFAIRASLAFIYPHEAIKNPEYQCYDQWPLECCQFFEDMTYDQILTASVLDILREDFTDTEVCQVLLWCTSADDFEVFINRKLVELNFANNVANDDSWMEQFQAVNPPPPLPPPPPSTSSHTIQPETGAESPGPVNQAGSPTSFQDQPQDGSADKDNEQAVAKMDQSRKIKIKTRSKKKKDINVGAKDENKDSNNSVGPAAPETEVPAVAPPMLTAEKNSSSAELPISAAVEMPVETNSLLLLHLSPEPKVQVVSLLVANSSEKERPHSPIQDETMCPGNRSKSVLDHYSHSLHHDPRLSNWIIQKHSRHVTLKKLEKISYLFRVTCYFDPGKFIGILPFGERKIDLEAMFQSINNSCSASPFRQFILEMTDHYRKQQNDSKLRLLPEQCVFEQANSSTIVFYESTLDLFLRGHIIGRDMTSDEQSGTQKKPPLNRLCSVGTQQQSSSSKDLLKVPMNDEHRPLKKKTLSLKRRSIHDITTRYLIYGIDSGRYFQVPLKHIYHLDDRFALAKPFAIVCKLHWAPTDDKSLNKLRQRLVDEDRFYGLRFIDIDFSTERFSVELHQLLPKSKKTENILDDLS